MSYHSSQDPEEKLPDWLKALRKRQGETGNLEESAETPEPPKAAEGVENMAAEEEPSWLKDIRQRYKREPGQARESEERALTDTQPTAPIKPLEKRRLGKDTEAEETAQGESFSQDPSQLPDWLTLQESEESSSEPTGAPTRAFGEGEGESLSPGEIPSWLQAIRPGNFPEEDTRSADMLPGVEATAGPLAGLSGVLPAEPEIVQFGKVPVFSARVDITESQVHHAAALSQLLANEAQPSEDISQRVALPTRVLNWTIAGVMLLATLLPLILQSQGAPRPELSAFPESDEIFNIIDVLPPDAPVLVAFEVHPSLFGEVQAPATAVLQHLLEKQARLVFVSTQPTGPALAEKLLQEQFGELPSVATHDYINLGYLSGGMAALRSFASDPRSATLSAAAALQNPWDSSALQAIEQISEFAFVLVLSSDAEDGRAWIEQTIGELNEGLVMVSSAQAAPLLRPYLRSDPVTLRGLVTGFSGAAYYERLHAQDGLGRDYWDAYSYGLGAIVLLVLLGGLYNLLIHTRPEKPSKQAEGKVAA